MLISHRRVILTSAAVIKSSIDIGASEHTNTCAKPMSKLGSARSPWAIIFGPMWSDSSTKRQKDILMIHAKSNPTPVWKIFSYGLSMGEIFNHPTWVETIFATEDRFKMINYLQEARAHVASRCCATPASNELPAH